jgi:hypothetical protein
MRPLGFGKMQASMRYIRVNWEHTSPTDPVVLYSEIDDAGWERRKVEVFRDGQCGYASESETTSDTFLGIEPMPTDEEIASDPQFKLAEIQQSEFETIWSQRR